MTTRSANDSEHYTTPRRPVEDIEGLCNLVEKNNHSCPPPPQPRQNRYTEDESCTVDSNVMMIKPMKPSLRIPTLGSVAEEPFKPISTFKLTPRKRNQDRVIEDLYFF